MIVKNEDRPGYKKTKIGWIPNEWEAIAFEKVVAKSQYGLSIASSETGHIPILGMKDISEGYVSFSDLAKVDVTGEQLQRHLVRKGDLLFNRTNSLEHVGKLGLVNTDERAVFASYLVRFQVKCTKTFPEYIAYVFSTEDARNRLRSLATPGVCQHNINQSTLQKHYTIPFPSLPEQKKIAEILCTWDEAIEQTQKLIEAKKRRKKALMQQLLTGKKRLPGLNKPWRRCKFRDVFERVVRNNTGGNTNVLTISGSSGLINQEEYFNKQVASKDLSGYYLLQFGEFAYNKSRSKGYPLGAIKRLRRYPAGVVSTLYFCFKLIHELDDAEFYEHYFKGGQHNQELYTIAHEGARCHGLLNISAHDIMDTQLRIPDSEEQRALADVLNEAEAEIKTTENKLTALKNQKLGLMQKLLTGEVRVSV